MESIPPVTFQSQITFILLGIASLIGWNAILTAMDFFSQYYPKDQYGDVSFLFPIPLFFGNFLWGLLVPKLAQTFSLTQRISVCLAGICVFMILLPLITITFQSNLGFYLCLCTTFIIGSLNSIAQNSCIGLASVVDGSLTGLFWVSTGVSGLSMNVAKAATQGIFGTSNEGNKIGTMIYFGIAVILTLAAIMSQIAFVKSPYYLHIAEQTKTEESPRDDEDMENIIISATSGDESRILSKQQSETISQQLKEYGNKLIAGIKLARFVPFFIFCMYVQTFIVYPGVSVFSKPEYHYLPTNWGTLLMLTIYNIGDIIGKQLSGYDFYNIPACYFTVCCRSGFIVTFLLTMRMKENAFFSNDTFAMVNMLLFAATNGFCTGGLMRLGSQRGQDGKSKELIGFISSFALTFGIAVGSCIAPAFSG